MERRGRGAKTAGIAADLVERYQSHVTVESRILAGLGHYWARRLLEMHRHPQHLGRAPIIRTVRWAGGQDVMEKIEDARIGGLPPLPCSTDRPFDVAVILRRGAPRRHIRAVHWKGCD